MTLNKRSAHLRGSLVDQKLEREQTPGNKAYANLLYTLHYSHLPLPPTGHAVNHKPDSNMNLSNHQADPRRVEYQAGMQWRGS